MSVLKEIWEGVDAFKDLLFVPSGKNLKLIILVVFTIFASPFILLLKGRSQLIFLNVLSGIGVGALVGFGYHLFTELFGTLIIPIYLVVAFLIVGLTFKYRHQNNPMLAWGYLAGALITTIALIAFW